MAVASDIDICNLALDHLGKQPIVSFTEGSTEAKACLRQYDVARRICLSKQPWSFARRTEALAPVELNHLTDDWTFAYDMPKAALRVGAVLRRGELRMTNQEPNQWYVESGVIYTDVDEAYLRYVRDSKDTASWSSMFDDAVALQIAARLATVMTRRRADVEMYQRMYEMAVAYAAEEDASQEVTRYTFHDGGYLDARGSRSYDRYSRQTDGSTIWG